MGKPRMPVDPSGRSGTTRQPKVFFFNLGLFGRPEAGGGVRQASSASDAGLIWLVHAKVPRPDGSLHLASGRSRGHSPIPPRNAPHALRAPAAEQIGEHDRPCRPAQPARCQQVGGNKAFAGVSVSPCGASLRRKLARIRLGRLALSAATAPWRPFDCTYQVRAIRSRRTRREDRKGEV